MKPKFLLKLMSAWGVVIVAIGLSSVALADFGSRSRADIVTTRTWPDSIPAPGSPPPFNLASRVGRVMTRLLIPANRRILMFVPYNEVWWTEYKVAYEAFRAQGYEIDVRSSAAGEALSYGSSVNATPSGTGLDPTYPAPVPYAQFQALFEANFGVPWETAWNTPQNIPLNGRIQDVTSLDSYDAIVIPGGRGAVAYRYDGTYAELSPQGNPGFHVTTAAEVQAAAQQLNLLIGLALQAGKPVGAECHAAPLAAFARVPGTAGEGFDGLGRSILEGGYATGYPFNNGDTAVSYANLGVTLLDREKLVLDGPGAPDFSGNGLDLVATTEDWYPTSAAYLVRTLLNILETYPTPSQQAQPVEVLVFGGDSPSLYADPPASHTDLVNLLNDISDGLLITATGTASITQMNLANLQNYEVLVYFRHNRIPQAAQEAIRAYVDAGGGLVAIHHALYNQQNAQGTLIDLLGGELPQGVTPGNENGLVYSGESNHLINVNLGHFVSTYGVHNLITQSVNYSSPLGLPNPNLDNEGNRGYYSFRIEAPDELYLGSHFNPGVVFGREVNQINRLFANDRFVAGSPNPNNGHYDTWGWTRRYDGDGDGQIGRIVYLQPGETNIRTLSHPAYRQVIKNAVIWSANQPLPPTPILSITKSGPSSAAPTIPITYSLTVTNRSLITATSLIITDAVPAGATYVTGGELIGQVVNWQVPSLGPSESVSVQFGVMATQTITNDTYGVSAGAVSARGETTVVTRFEGEALYLPFITRD